MRYRHANAIWETDVERPAVADGERAVGEHDVASRIGAGGAEIACELSGVPPSVRRTGACGYRVGPHAVVQPLGHKVQVCRPLPGLPIRNGLGRRNFGIIETEARRELDGKRAPLAPGRPELIRNLLVHGGDTNPVARRPFTRRSLPEPHHHRSAENYRVGHPVILPHQPWARRPCRRAGRDGLPSQPAETVGLRADGLLDGLEHRRRRVLAVV